MFEQEFSFRVYFCKSAKQLMNESFSCDSSYMRARDEGIKLKNTMRVHKTRVGLSSPSDYSWGKKVVTSRARKRKNPHWKIQLSFSF